MLNIGAVTGTSQQTVVASGNNSKGSWVQLTASLSADIVGFVVHMQVVAGNMGRVDIGIGGSGSEVVLAPDLLVIGRGDTPVQQVFVPIPIAAGTRISARAMIIGASPNCLVGLLGHEDSDVTFPTYTAMTAHGFSSGSSPGTTITPHASGNTKGSWTQIVAATSVDYQAIIVQVSNLNAFSSGGKAWLLDIGTGASSSEVVIAPDIPLGEDSALDFMWPVGGMGPYPLDIPSGTRIAARAQCSTGGSTFGIAVYGLSGGASGGGIAGSNVSIWDGAAWVS